MHAPPKPFVLRSLFSGPTLELLQSRVRELKSQPNLREDEDRAFNRVIIHNDEVFRKFHLHLLPVAIDIFGIELKPSYHMASFYHPGRGECPLHVDRKQCFLTIDVCVDQSAVWPLMVNGEKDFSTVPNRRFVNDPNVEAIKANSTPYYLEPGDAVCYSGTHHAHWRAPKDDANFCDLIFFHFVEKDFEGSLE